MKISFLFIFFDLSLFNANSNLSITMKIEDVDDCITEVYIGNIIKYSKPSHINCWWNAQQNDIIINSLPYQINQEIKIVVKDLKGEWNEAGIKITVYLNEFIIKTERKKFWKCLDCLTNDKNYVYDYSKNRLDCFEGFINEDHTFNFIFKIDSFDELIDAYDGIGIYRLPYYLASQKYFFKYITNLDNPVDLISHLNSKDFIYAKNGDKIIEPIYELLGFQIYFDSYFPSSYFEILSINELNDEIKLKTEPIYNIQKNNLLRYRLQKNEKFEKGVHLKFKMRIFELKNKATNIFEEFNFFICLNEYKICDADTYMKCLNEGYYKSGEFYYSCYETCKTCDKFQKPYASNYTNNYCDSCKTEFPYFVNVTDNENDFYISCYRLCPNHAPYLKEANSLECLSQCHKYKTNDLFCVDNCDYDAYKYFLKENETCYNYIPNNYSLFIDNYNDKYDSSNIPIINIINKCQITMIQVLKIIVLS